ncbi:MAG: hypothetical protein MUO58_05260 [Anaerolineales bacterium]|nr:hypothetical protein [Anaerolineales bacterium]
MNQIPCLRRFRRLLAFEIVLLLAAGMSSCMPSALDITDVELQPIPPELTIDSTAPTPTQPAVPIVAAPREATPAPLSEDGPWWILNTMQGLWIMNADGSGLKALYLSAEANPDPIHHPAIAPGGDHIAFVSSSDWEEGIRLHILSLPEADETVIQVLPAGIPHDLEDFEPGNPAFEADQASIALLNINSIAWSPDGVQLAFVGMIDGPSTDLYLYDVASGEILRLSDGPSHAIRPSWSPDGDILLHAGVQSFGNGAGYNMAGVWAVDLSDFSICSIDAEALRGNFLFRGWLDNTTFILASWDAWCGLSNLRAVDVESGTIQTLWPGAFIFSGLDPKSMHLLLEILDYTANDPYCGGQGIDGVVLVRPDGEVQPLPLEPGRQIMWAPALEAFLLVDENPLPVSLDGTPGEVLPAMPCISPDGMRWAFHTEQAPGYWIGEIGRIPENELDACRADQVGWSPDGESFIFHHVQGIYTARAPDFDPVLVSTDLVLDYDDPFLWAGE